MVASREEQIKALTGNIDDDVLFLDYHILAKDGEVKFDKWKLWLS